jgi:spoIIIJ-associated protein
MKQEAIATGRTVEAAIEAACEQLSLSRDEVEFEIIDMPRKGFFGLSQLPAKVRIWKDNAQTKSQVAVSYLRDIVRAMGLPQATIDVAEKDETLSLRINADTAGVTIGRRGETLDALQYLVGLGVNRVEGDYVRIVLDSGNYREKRRNTLEQLAKKLASSALKTGRSTTLEPMNPYERRIIHSAIAQIEGVVSSSVGEEPNRHVVISPTDASRAQATEKRGYYRDNRGGAGGGSGSTGGARPAQGAGGSRGPSQSAGGRGPDRRGGRNDRGRHSDRGPRREKPEPYQESHRREVAPAEAADKPLYGKIDL